MRCLIGILVVLTVILAASSRLSAQSPDYVLTLTDETTPTGSSADVTIHFDVSGTPVDGMTLGICHDSSELELTAIADGQALIDLNPDFVASDEVAGGFVLGLVVDFTLTAVIPVGLGYELWVVTYLATGPDGVVSDVCFCDTLATTSGVLIVNEVIVTGGSVTPTQECGSVTISTVVGELFRRGDANGDGGYDISDAISILAQLFSGAPTPCLDASDVNDDSGADIADAIFVLANLFSGGADPSAPGAACGADPTLDAIACASYPNCP